MVGKFDIEIYNNKVHYYLSVKRNITILQGDSATGKTELIRLIAEHTANGVSSGVTLICSAPCTVLTAIDWELRLASLKGNIIFIDETAGFLRSERFAQLVQGSDNYFVIVSRDDLSQLPYSIDEIYGLRNVSDSQKYKSYHKVYNEMYRLYHFDEMSSSECPASIITEDSNSGYEFYDLLFPGMCRSAHGKSNIFEVIHDLKQTSSLVVVDGAAFGSEIGKIMRYLETSRTNCVIYAPESFEYLLLRSELIDVPHAVLDETYQYADSTLYTSWEAFYTAFLSNITRNTVFQYSKTKLPNAYKTNGATVKIIRTLPEPIQKWIPSSIQEHDKRED
ncbi:MAG: translation initiation factor 2 [Lachnospiraceae bacterium]|nr:translation initiation factor 2 [Lachnospiraceae bacterium]